MLSWVFQFCLIRYSTIKSWIWGSSIESGEYQAKNGHNLRMSCSLGTSLIVNNRFFQFSAVSGLQYKSFDLMVYCSVYFNMWRSFLTLLEFNCVMFWFGWSPRRSPRRNYLLRVMLLSFPLKICISLCRWHIKDISIQLIRPLRRYFGKIDFFSTVWLS